METKFFYFNLKDPSDDAELIEVSPTVMYTSSPSGEATVSPGVITSDGIEECIIDDDNDDMGKKNYQ